MTDDEVGRIWDAYVDLAGEAWDALLAALETEPAA